jgi:hypothetical protein
MHANHTLVMLIASNIKIDKSKFINESNNLFTHLLNYIDNQDIKQNCKGLVDKHYNDWSVLYKLNDKDNKKSKNDKDKTARIYKQLKESLVFKPEQATVVDYNLDTIEQVKMSIKQCLQLEQHNRTKTVQYELGMLLSKLNKLVKQKKPEFQKISNETTGYSVSYAYFLISFYTQCEKYPNLKFNTISVKTLQKYLTKLLPYMKGEALFWGCSNITPEMQKNNTEDLYIEDEIIMYNNT